MLILVDESILLKDYYMESPDFSAVRKYGTVILCQCVLDRLFPVFLKEHDKKQLEEYKNFIDTFLIENGSIYPERYPHLTDEEKQQGLAESTSYLFWKNCLDIFRHYVLEDVHIVTEKEEFFSQDSRLYLVIQSDLASVSAEHHNIYFWNGAEKFCTDYIFRYNSEKDYRLKLISETEKNKKGFADPLRKAVSDLEGKDISDYLGYEKFVVSEICTDGFEINDIISIENNICTLETAVQCSCCADDKEHFLEICFVVRYDLLSETTAECEIDCISEEYYD